MPGNFFSFRKEVSRIFPIKFVIERDTKNPKQQSTCNLLCTFLKKENFRKWRDLMDKIKKIDEC